MSSSRMLWPTLILIPIAFALGYWLRTPAMMDDPAIDRPRQEALRLNVKQLETSLRAKQTELLELAGDLAEVKIEAQDRALRIERLKTRYNLLALSSLHKARVRCVLKYSDNSNKVALSSLSAVIHPGLKGTWLKRAAKTGATFIPVVGDIGAGAYSWYESDRLEAEFKKAQARVDTAQGGALKRCGISASGLL